MGSWPDWHTEGPIANLILSRERFEEIDIMLESVDIRNDAVLHFNGKSPQIFREFSIERSFKVYHSKTAVLLSSKRSARPLP
jgi:hypothetical protein